MSLPLVKVGDIIKLNVTGDFYKVLEVYYPGDITRLEVADHISRCGLHGLLAQLYLDPVDEVCLVLDGMKLHQVFLYEGEYEFTSEKNFSRLGK